MRKQPLTKDEVADGLYELGGRATAVNLCTHLSDKHNLTLGATQLSMQRASDPGGSIVVEKDFKLALP